MNEKKSFFDSLQNGLLKISDVVNRNIYIMAIKDGMLAYMPFTFIASIFLIIAYLPIPGFQNLVSSITGLDVSVWQPALCLVNDASLGLGGLLVLLSVSHNLAKQMNLNVLQVQMTAFLGFMLLVPFGTTKAGTHIATSYLGAPAIFLSLLCSILAAVIYRFIDHKGIKIKMPASVPPAVSAPFESIIPSLVAIIVFWVIRLLIDGFNAGSALAIFNTVLGAPLAAVGGSLPGVIIVKMFSQLLWFFGIHGDSIVNGVMTPIFQVLQSQNQAASLAGQVPPNIICQSFWDSYASIGIIGSILAIVLIAKSKRYIEMKKIAAVPYIFNVGEPTLFGIPLMMNVTYFVPFILSNVASILIAYGATAIGLVPKCTGLAQVPWTTPLLVSGYLVTNSIRGSILQLVCIIVVVLIWMPFVKVADTQILKEEQESQTE